MDESFHQELAMILWHFGKMSCVNRLEKEDVDSWLGKELECGLQGQPEWRKCQWKEMQQRVTGGAGHWWEVAWKEEESKGC